MRPIRAFTALLSSLLAVYPLLPATAAPAAPTPACTINDDRLAEISGMVATDSGYAVINDGSDDILDVRVHLLDSQCGFEDVLIFPRQPRDPEDLARTPDGTLWIGDLGDNNRDRTTAAIWMVKPNGNSATLYRLRYPDGAHDAEALIMPATNIPIIITKEITGPAKVFQATAPLSGGDATFDLAEVGTFQPEQTDTSGGDPSIGPLNQLLVTGAALSADGSKVAVRTYTDAYEWDVPAGGDIATAITSSAPRRTALPDEPLGEAIAYTADGKFVTTSEGVGQPINQWTPTAPAQSATVSGSDSAKSDQPWYSDITLDQLMYGVYVVGFIGLALVGAGIVGIVRHRRRAAAAEDDKSKPREVREITAGDRREEPGGKAVYGSRNPLRPALPPGGTASHPPSAPGPAPNTPSSGRVYGKRPANPRPSPRTYGGQP